MPVRSYRRLIDLPQALPVFPLDGALLLPGGELPLQIFEPRYLAMVDDVLAGDRLIGMIQTRGAAARSRPRLAGVGCAGRLTRYAETPDGKYLITLSGICRFEVDEELSATTPYRQVRPRFARFEADLAGDDETLEFERAPFLALLRRYLDRRGLGIEWDAVAAAPAPALINSLSMALPFEPAEKQALLEAAGLHERREALGTLLEIGAIRSSEDDDEPPPVH
ncbi:MAG: LON peptidase substrate-binding domain-containing protein [Caulobacteraceae bacterium]